MSQNDFSIADASGGVVLADLNGALQALASLSSGATAPTTTYAYQIWIDTTTGLIKQRNAANSAWLEVGDANAAAFGILSRIVASMNLKQLNASSNYAEIGRIEPVITGTTAGSETGFIRFHDKVSGVLTKRLDLGALPTFFSDAVQVQWADGGATTGPTFNLFRDSVSPAANDLLGQITFNFRDSTNVATTGAALLSTLLDPTNASEDSSLEFSTIVAGALAKRAEFRAGLQIGAPTGGDKGAGTINLSSGGYVNNSPMLVAGKQALGVLAASMQPATTNGAAPGVVETTTNKVPYRTLDFDAATQEFAAFDLVMPKSWNVSTITFRVRWTAASGSGGVAWQLQGVAFSDGDASDAAYGTAVVVTDTLISAGALQFTAESGAVTIGGSPASQDLVNFRIARVPADAADTLAVDARLRAVDIFITTNAANDA